MQKREIRRLKQLERRMQEEAKQEERRLLQGELEQKKEKLKEIRWLHKPIRLRDIQASLEKYDKIHEEREQLSKQVASQVGREAEVAGKSQGQLRGTLRVGTLSPDEGSLSPRQTSLRTRVPQKTREDELHQRLFRSLERR